MSSIHRSHRLRRTLSTAVAATLAAGGVVALASPSQADEQTVSGVQFRWGFNNESNNTGAAPGTVNLFSAGKLGNPESGNILLSNSTSGATWANGKAAGWKATSGNVWIEKKRTDGTYASATWAGLKTDKDGAALGNYAANTKFSDHQVVVDAGTGTVDPDADNAEITWDGDFTVVFYSGYTFFYVSDPKLTVTDGTGTVTATLGGYGTSMTNPDLWTSLPDTQVTLANLQDVDVTADGIVATPEYANVPYTAPSGGTAQVTTGSHPGSFPQSFVDYVQTTGGGPYWYSTGGSVDKNKAAAPITVDLDPAPRATTAPSSVAAATTRLTYGKGGSLPVTVSSTGTPTGTVTLTGVGTSQTKALSAGKATFALPKNLAVKNHAATVRYNGAAGFDTSTKTVTVAVAKASSGKPTVKVTKKPTSKKTGKATVTVKSTVSGLVPTGKVRITLTKGKSVKRINTTLSKGKRAVKLPKLKKGTWKLNVTYYGSSTQGTSTSKTYKIKSSK